MTVEYDILNPEKFEGFVTKIERKAQNRKLWQFVGVCMVAVGVIWVINNVVDSYQEEDEV